MRRRQRAGRQRARHPGRHPKYAILFKDIQSIAQTVKKAAPYPLLLAYLLPYALLITVGLVLYLFAEHTHHKTLLQANEQLQIELARKSLTRDLEQVLPDINVLANERHLQNYINSFSDAARRALSEELISFALQKRAYSVIRLLDLEGRERLRVDYKNGRAHAASDDELQDKSGRYYFSDSKTLGRGELYVSPIDLNVEYNRIEIPYVPVIRFAMPVFDRQAEKRGILVLSYLAQPMLEHFDEMLAGSRGHVGLLNGDGYWLRSHRKEREWSFMFGTELTFARAHPDIWRELRHNDAGSLLDHQGMFTYTTIYPLTIVGGYSATEVEDTHLGHHHSDPKSYVWKIVSDVPIGTVRQALSDAVVGPVGLLWLSLLLAGTIATRLIAVHRMERRELAAQVELHAKLYETTTEGVMITDREGSIIAVNDAFTAMTGYRREEVLGNNPRMLSSGRHDREFYRHMWATLMQKGHWEGEIYNRRKDGGLYIEWIRISAIFDHSGELSNYVAIFSDVTSRKLGEEQLLKRAHHDPLTGLHNRLSFDERLNQELARARRTRSKLGLLYIDLDAFKPINDSYGHRTGDAVLREVGARLKSAVREMDTVSRIGGDEFTVVLPEINKLESVEAISDDIRRRLQLPFEYEGQPLALSASIGAALFPDDAGNERELLARADADMYRVKQDARAKPGLRRSI